MKKKIVIKFSGKVFAMENVKLLKDYARFLVKISKTYQPIIVAGGGKIARHYITHARSSGADESTLDELGIEISRLNAKLLIYALKGKAYPHPPTTLPEVKIFNEFLFDCLFLTFIKIFFATKSPGSIN